MVMKFCKPFQQFFTSILNIKWFQTLYGYKFCKPFQTIIHHHLKLSTPKQAIPVYGYEVL